jgi:crotonobetainyl-CoA:carnitine CoA-transferase CaiB-like acyl-CoA transferase
MEQPELFTDPRFATHVARGENQELLDSIINDWTGSRTVADVASRLEEYSVPCGKIYRAPEMLDDPHFKARNSIVATPTERWPELKMQNVFPVLSESPGEVRWPGVEELGAHNQEVYEEYLGLSPDDLEKLKERYIV